TQNDTLYIVATTTQAHDLVRILTEGVPDHAVSIVGLMGAGVDPHLYQPTESDIAAMNQANMVVYSGLNLEGQFETVFEALGERGIVTFALSKPVKDAGFVLGGFIKNEGEAPTDDPHFWFDPRNWALSAQALGRQLARLDPEHAELYLTNAEEYSQALMVLYEWSHEALAQIPEQQRYLVTSHDAFRYFGGAFDLGLQSVQGISTEDEAGVGDIQSVIDFIVSRQIPVMFIESSVPIDTIQAVQEGAAAQGWEVRIGVRELYGDAMGEPNTFGGTYIGMIATNVITILQSFGLPIPPWPEDLPIQPDANLFVFE
ncbi:MAG: manganese transporter, partial [Phototrophicales bacterium]